MSDDLYTQSAISRNLGVRADFNAAAELAARTRFLADCLLQTGRRALAGH